MGALSDDRLAEARAAVGRGEWQVALDLLSGVEGDEARAGALELRANAAYGAGDFEGAVNAWEELHSFFLLEDDDVEAARAAAMIAMYLMMDTGLMAPVRGWIRCAERLLEGRAETPAHALIAMVRTYERFMCGDMDAARASA